MSDKNLQLAFGSKQWIFKTCKNGWFQHLLRDLWPRIQPRSPAVNVLATTGLGSSTPPGFLDKCTFFPSFSLIKTLHRLRVKNIFSTGQCMGAVGLKARRVPVSLSVWWSSFPEWPLLLQVLHSAGRQTWGKRFLGKKIKPSYHFWKSGLTHSLNSEWAIFERRLNMRCLANIGKRPQSEGKTSHQKLRACTEKQGSTFESVTFQERKVGSDMYTFLGLLPGWVIRPNFSDLLPTGCPFSASGGVRNSTGCATRLKHWDLIVSPPYLTIIFCQLKMLWIRNKLSHLWLIYSTRVPRPFNGGKNSLLNQCCDSGYPHTKISWSWTLTLYHIQKLLKMVKSPKQKAKAIETLETNTSVNLSDPMD